MVTDDFSVAPELQSAARIGLIQIDDVRVRESPEELKALLDEAAARTVAQYGDRQAAEIPTVQAIRRIFHKSGVDPTRYRPSSEALLRRVLKSRGLYLVNSAVDLVNYFSLTKLWPMGLFDLKLIKPPVVFRSGREGETYQGIGREMLNLKGFPLLADEEGPFGSAISDSMRTRVTESATSLLWVVFAPAGAEMDLQTFATTMVRFNGGSVTMTAQLC
jgi:DNA/RNA-binding domain of Phe-tRNA-synthetase-like protein